MAEAKRPLKVFLCHARSDQVVVRDLHSRLTRDGVDAWLDKEKLLPGQDWEYEIRQAVRDADVVIVCLSKQFNQAGFRQKEVRIALNEADIKPEGEIFIIPARFEECSVPQSLQRWQWVDLFEDEGYARLVHALRVRAKKIGVVKLPSIRKPPAKNNSTLRILVADGKVASRSAHDVAYLVGEQVIIRGHTLFSNGAGGVNRDAAQGALQACEDKLLSPEKYIQVYRPRDYSFPEFNFGQTYLIGQTYSQCKNHVVDNSDAVIIIGGGGGTRKVANRALLVGKPLIPLGIGDPTEAAFDFWQKMLTGVMDSFIHLVEDFQSIGRRYSIEAVAVNALVLAEKLASQVRP